MTTPADDEDERVVCADRIGDSHLKALIEAADENASVFLLLL